MTFAETLYDYLKNRVGVAALVGTRIHPVKLPQGSTLPALTFQRISDVPEYSHGGGMVREPMFQVTAWAGTYLEAEALSTQVILSANAWFHTMRGSAFVSGVADLSEPMTKVYQVAVDVTFYGIVL